jgi:hypothetical protein
MPAQSSVVMQLCAMSFFSTTLACPKNPRPLYPVESIRLFASTMESPWTRIP